MDSPEWAFSLPRRRKQNPAPKLRTLSKIRRCTVRKKEINLYNVSYTFIRGYRVEQYEQSWRHILVSLWGDKQEANTVTQLTQQMCLEIRSDTDRNSSDAITEVAPFQYSPHLIVGHFICGLCLYYWDLQQNTKSSLTTQEKCHFHR